MGGKARRRIAKEANEMAAEQLKVYKEEQAIQRKILAKQKQEYKNFEFKNPYGGLQNYYEGMENVFEDMTVSTQAADFQMERGDQQRANIMQSLSGAAGGSGIASLAQSMAMQGQLQSQQIAANIAQQERQHAIMSAKMAGQIDMTMRGGEAMVQSAEMGRQSTLLGIAYGGMAGANAGVQAAYANQMAGFGMRANMLSSQVGASAAIISGGLQGMSDRRLKKNINLIGKSPSGINIYTFEYKYKFSQAGVGLFQGVMSDEVPEEAVIPMDGYNAVNYNMLDVEFKNI